MAKKIKRSPVSKPIPDPQLEEVDEERAFEVEYDEETNEAIMVHHYRRIWGDDFDSDIEHGLSMEENKDLINILTEIYIQQQKVSLLVAVEKGMGLVEKSTPELIEGNPLKGDKNSQ